MLLADYSSDDHCFEFDSHTGVYSHLALPMARKGARTALLLVVPALFGMGCATIQRYEVTEQKRTLTAAGFQIHPADTPERQQDLRSMPRHRIVSRTKDGNVVYMYADPDDCQCTYVGGDKEYAEYERLLRVERKSARRPGGSSPSGGAVGGAP